MPATKKHTQHAPSTKTECDYLNGWIKKRAHTQKSHPKVVNPRDIAGERKKKKKEKKKRKFNLSQEEHDSHRVFKCHKRQGCMLLPTYINEREGERERGRQTDRDGETGTEREGEREREREREREDKEKRRGRDGETKRRGETDRQTERQRQRLRRRHKDRDTERDKETREGHRARVCSTCEAEVTFEVMESHGAQDPSGHVSPLSGHISDKTTAQTITVTLLKH